MPSFLLFAYPDPFLVLLYPKDCIIQASCTVASYWILAMDRLAMIQKIGQQDSFSYLISCLAVDPGVCYILHFNLLGGLYSMALIYFQSSLILLPFAILSGPGTDRVHYFGQSLVLHSLLCILSKNYSPRSNTLIRSIFDTLNSTQF